jgi:hypothetical protein
MMAGIVLSNQYLDESRLDRARGPSFEFFLFARHAGRLLDLSGQRRGVIFFRTGTTAAYRYWWRGSLKSNLRPGEAG